MGLESFMKERQVFWGEDNEGQTKETIRALRRSAPVERISSGSLYVGDSRVLPPGLPRTPPPTPSGPRWIFIRTRGPTTHCWRGTRVDPDTLALYPLILGPSDSQGSLEFVSIKLRVNNPSVLPRVYERTTGSLREPLPLYYLNCRTLFRPNRSPSLFSLSSLSPWPFPQRYDSSSSVSST